MNAVSELRVRVSMTCKGATVSHRYRGGGMIRADRVRMFAMQTPNSGGNAEIFRPEARLSLASGLIFLEIERRS